MNLLPLEARRGRRGDRGHRRPAVLPARLRGRHARRAARAHRARASTAAFRATVDSVEYLGADSLVDVPARRDARSPCACRAASGWRAATRRGSRGRPARSTVSIATACVAPCSPARTARRCSPSTLRSFQQRRRDHAAESHPHGAAFVAALRAIVAGAAALAQAPVEVSFYYPGRRRRTDHQDHRRLRRGLREGKSRHQAEADLLGHLPGHDHQGADRA